MLNIPDSWWMVIVICATMVMCTAIMAGAVTRYQGGILFWCRELTLALRHISRSYAPEIQAEIEEEE